MYKYTYLLSDSYRQDKGVSLPYHPNQHIQERSTSRNPRQPIKNVERAQSSAGLLYELKNQYQNFQRKQLEVQPLSQLQHNQIKINRNPHESKIKPYQNEMNLDQRLRNLSSLGDRHSQALREATLAGKLQHISNKYNSTKEGAIDYNNRSISQYRTDKQNKPYAASCYKETQKIYDCPHNDKEKIMSCNISFRQMPKYEQSLLQVSRTQPLDRESRSTTGIADPVIPKSICVKPEDEVTKKSVKSMVDQYMTKRKALDHHRQPLKISNNNRANQDHSKKLIDLQKRIQDSIKPYMNS